LIAEAEAEWLATEEAIERESCASTARAGPHRGISSAARSS